MNGLYLWGPYHNYLFSVGEEIADFLPIFAGSSSSVTYTKNSSIHTNRKSTTRFPMSPRWISYFAPKPPQKRKTAAFRAKSHFHWGKSATMFLYVKTVSDKVVRHSLPYYPCKNDWRRTSPSAWNFGLNWQRWSEVADFRSIFACSASAVTPSEKSSINTNSKSTTRFPMSPRWPSYVVPKGGSKLSKIRTMSCDGTIWEVSYY